MERGGGTSVTASVVRPYLAQARLLALQDPTRPQQANLRAAVSRAYYAIFHFLIEEANRFYLGTTPENEGFRDLLGRVPAFRNGDDRKKFRRRQPAAGRYTTYRPPYDFNAVAPTLTNICDRPGISPSRGL